jgi:hypothetical protein
MYQLKSIIPTLFFSSLTFVSCKKFLEIPPPSTQIEQTKVFETDQTAISAMAGLYSRLISSPSLSLVNGGTTVYLGLAADELKNTTSTSTADPFYLNNLLPTNSTVSANFWSAAYRGIFQTNEILEGLSNSATISDSVKNQLRGEALVLRATYYFYLTNLFGDVPLELTTDFQKNSVMPRTSSIQVYQQIVTDLIEAQSLLKSSYPTAGRLRINKFSATALLARVYLYMSDWTNAESQATAVITSGVYILTPKANIANAFAAGSTETILSITRETNNTMEGSAFTPASGKPAYELTSSLKTAFEPGDLRLLNWVKLVTIANPAPSTTYYQPAKYKQRVATTPLQENLVFFRLAEQFLIRAEARAQLNSNIAGARADIDTLRHRAGLLSTGANNQVLLLQAIEQERRIELMFEWGHRWFDLKRTNRADVVLSAFKGNSNWQLTPDIYFPIPSAEIKLNPALIQNQGY